MCISNLIKLFFLHASLLYCSPSGSTPIPCTGVWVTVACGISTAEESDCEFTTSLTVLSVITDQLGSNASCQYYEKQEEATPSERYGIQLNGI